MLCMKYKNFTLSYIHLFQQQQLYMYLKNFSTSKKYHNLLLLQLLHKFYLYNFHSKNKDSLMNLQMKSYIKYLLSYHYTFKESQYIHYQLSSLYNQLDKYHKENYLYMQNQLFNMFFFNNFLKQMHILLHFYYIYNLLHFHKINNP